MLMHGGFKTRFPGAPVSHVTGGLPSGGNDLDVVWLELGIGRRDRNPFCLRLRNKEAVKRIAMMKRQPCNANGVAKLNRDRMGIRHRQSFRDVFSGRAWQWEFT